LSGDEDEDVISDILLVFDGLDDIVAEVFDEFDEFLAAKIIVDDL
jgi:hypothetical protein